MKTLSILLCVSWSFIATNALALDTSSGITIKNTSVTTYNITGIYIQGLATGSGCTALSSPTITPAHGTATGVAWLPLGNMTTNATFAIGANFLYQMMSEVLYQVYNDLLSSSNSTQIQITCHDTSGSGAVCTANSPGTQNFP